MALGCVDTWVGVVGADHVAEEEHVVVVSRSLTFYNLYEFIYNFKSFII